MHAFSFRPFRPFRLSLLAATLSAALAAPALAADWATSVVQYSAGSTYPSPDPNDYSFVPPVGGVDAAYTTLTAAKLSGLSADTGQGTPYPALLTPFNGAYQTSQYVGIGQGGSLTLQFPAPVRITGNTVGVHSASGLIDFNYPNGSAGATATPYTTSRRATVAVSADNLSFFTLGTFDFNNPSNYYATGIDTPGSQPSNPAGTLADVEKPFLGTLASFNGESWPQILATLDGSAGGTWLNLSASGLPSVSYIRFTVPTGSILYLDGVVGLPAPEPASLTLLSLGVMGLMLRRRRSL